MISRYIALILASILLAACDTPTAPATSAAIVAPAQSLARSAKANEDNCTFSKGTTTCTSTVQYQETSSHSEYSGCLYGPNAVTGSRVRTFSDVYLVTVTTTTYRRGRSDHVYDSQTTTTRQRQTSTQTSDVCQPL
jgi:late competence protein required for DNA uptake (superfamily II DNA/RNA helicase)